MTKGTSLRWLMVRATSLVAIAGFVILLLGTLVYALVWSWLHPNQEMEPNTTVADLILIAGLLGASLATAVAIGWRIARRVITRLQALGDAAERIAHGEFRTRVAPPTRRMGELDDLVDNFNKMATLLESAQADLTYQNSAIAHELRTPLTILKGRLQGLRDGVFVPAPEIYGGLISHVDALTRIVDDLRTLSLFSAGQLDLVIEPVDLRVELEEIVGGFVNEFDKAGVAVSTACSDVTILADRARVRQVALALLNNACRYAPSSHLHISLDTIGDSAVLAVRDSGSGLPDDELNHVFERFWRADQSRSRAGGGSGLGLSIVRAIAEAHGGSASAQRNQILGLTFSVTLPVAGPKAA